MILTVKQLKQHDQPIAPQTIAEAVLVKHNSQIITLDQVLKTKVDSTADNSGLTIEGNTITHTSILTKIPEKPTAVKVLYNESGHIIGTSDLTVQVNNNPYSTANDNFLNFGDDFEIDENSNIKLKWNGIT